MNGGRLPRRIEFGNLEGAVRRGRGGKEKKWTDCIQSDIRAFGIAGDWKATALKADVWVETVTEGGQRFMAAWRKEEVDAARHRQEKREATRLEKLLSHTEAWKFREATPIDLVDEPKKSFYGRETERAVCVGGGRGVCCQTFSFVLFSLFSRPRAGLATV